MIKRDNSISELRKVNIGDTELEIMIRGNDRDNPVLIFVHGGPSCYRRKELSNNIYFCTLTVTREDVRVFMAERPEYTKANRFKDIVVKVYI